jgi:hypothetical protein
MSNNNLADISQFESLQSDQHNRTNMSQMAVFNDVADIKKAAERVSKAAQQEIATKSESDKAVQALTDALRQEHKRISGIADATDRDKEKQQLKAIVASMKVPSIYDKNVFITGVDAIK